MHHVGIDAVLPPGVCPGSLPSRGTRQDALYSTYPRTWMYSSPNALTFADVFDASPHAIYLRPPISILPCRALQLATGRSLRMIICGNPTRASSDSPTGTCI
uniref:Uncharacterized protein n=1 Tax=Physcomitrium patens TaxID=3218 RepID=A0A2K1J759_PHYPA|nr:hypothetical protein PHYPA_020483 [Physcomitrium patens]